MLRRLLTHIKPRTAEQRALGLKIKAITGFLPHNLICYEQALRHHSVSKTIHNNGSKDSNERLEFLGDAVLNAIVAEYLFKKYPFKDEGFLTQLRSKIVSRESLNELAIKIQLNKLVEYDRKALQNINLRNSIFGNALEAFLGAVFIDGGFDTCKKFIATKLLRYHIDVDKLQITETNFKGRLIEFGQKNAKTIEFEVGEQIDGKNKIYTIKVIIDGKDCGQAQHISKKKAEQMAAQKAFEQMDIIPSE
ncbi:MAG: ribonuclease III [Bacteroidota bacterium]|nr:ribonuclease III [Bacteroidota bacterium]